MVDDYCTIARGQELDAWRGMLHYLNSYAGGYSNYFIKTLTAPLDRVVPALTLPMLILMWFCGSAWLMNQLLGICGFMRLRRSAACGLSAALAGMSINAFPAQISYYWHAASTHYITPLFLLTVFFALTLWIIRRDAQGRAFIGWAAVGMGICFISAGMHELMAAFQFAFLLLCLLAGLSVLPRRVRYSYLRFAGTGLLATAVGLLIALNSPGIAQRAARIYPGHTAPYRVLETLVSATGFRVYALATDLDSYSGFVLLFCLGLFTTLAIYRPQGPILPMLPPRYSRIPLLAALIIQLLLLPLIWQHRSDERQFLGLFSLDYLAVVLLNALFIATLLIWLWQHERLNRALEKTKVSWLLLTFGLFILTALPLAAGGSRAVHIRASIMLQLSWLVMLGLCAYPFARLMNREWTKRIALLLCCYYGISWMTTAGFISLEYYFAGRVTMRTLNFVAWLSTLPGLVWGMWLGWAVMRHRPRNWQEAAAFKCLKLGSQVGALAICAGVLLGHGRDISRFQAYARDWDRRHESIISQRESGKRVIEVAPLSFDLAKHLGIYQKIGDDSLCAPAYYKVDAIVVKRE